MVHGYGRKQQPNSLAAVQNLKECLIQNLHRIHVRGLKEFFHGKPLKKEIQKITNIVRDFF